MHYASYEGDIKSTRILLEHGADMNFKDNKGITPIDLAKSDEIKKLFEERVNIDIKEPEFL